MTGFKYLRWMLLALFICCTQGLQAGIVSIEKLESVCRRVECLLEQYEPHEILVVFDIDLTLTAPGSKAAQAPNVALYKQEYAALTAGLTPDQKLVMLNLSSKKAPSLLIEAKAPAIIKQIQGKGIKAIALTASLTGSLGTIPSVEVWRFENLQRLGINFQEAFPGLKELKLTSLPSYLKSEPTYYRGILCANEQPKKIPKGETLYEFLKKVKFLPRIIVFVDDRRTNLEAVQTFFQEKKPSIEFIGLHYTKGLQFTSGTVSQEQFSAFWKAVADEARQLVP